MSKISNLQLLNGETLMELALNELDKRFDKIVAKGKGTFKFTFEHGDLINRKNVINKENLMNYIIEVKFESKAVGDSGHMKQKFRNHYVVFVNTYFASKESLRDTYVHEITHVSQKFNNFLEYSNNHEAERYQRDIVAKKRKSKVSIKKYYNNRHHENLAEHEAVLSSVLQRLKEGSVDSAVRYMLDRYEYFHFEWKKFIQKAYAYGVSKENIIKAKEGVIKAFDNEINLCEIRDSYFFWENMSSYFVKRICLMNMFGLGEKYLKATYEIGNKISITKPEYKMDKKLSYIKEQLEFV